MDTSITVNNKDSDRLKQAAAGLMLAILIGAVGYSAKVLTKSHLVDPLLVAMVIGIIVRTGIPDSRRFSPGFTLAPAIFIPVGIAFYAAKNDPSHSCDRGLFCGHTLPGETVGAEKTDNISNRHWFSYLWCLSNCHFRPRCRGRTG